MKEISIEDKAKRYDEAVKKLKVLYDDWATTQNRAAKEVEEIFPELKESEDERIRKEIISYVKRIANTSNISPDQIKECNAWIAWLEKQGEKDSQVIYTTFTFDNILALQCCMETVKKVQEDKDLYNELLLLHNKVYDAYTITKNKLL